MSVVVEDGVTTVIAVVDWIKSASASYFSTPGATFEWRFTGCVNPASSRAQTNVAQSVRIGGSTVDFAYDLSDTCTSSAIAAAPLTAGSVTTSAANAFTAATASYTLGLTPSASHDIAAGHVLSIVFPTGYSFSAPALTDFSTCTSAGTTLSCTAALPRTKAVVRFNTSRGYRVIFPILFSFPFSQSLFPVLFPFFFLPSLIFPFPFFPSLFPFPISISLSHP